MSQSKWEASLFRLLVQHLRVPELIYPFELGSSDALVERNRQVSALVAECSRMQSAAQGNLLQLVNATFENKGCSAQANNLAFFLDRVFDVWLRKNAFQVELKERFDAWRFSFYAYSLPVYAGDSDLRELKQHELQLGKLIHLMDSLADYAKKWSPVPKRSKHIFLEHLQAIEAKLTSSDSRSSNLIDAIEEEWTAFTSSQNEKITRVSERLIQGEYRKNHTQYCLWLAYHYLNVIFKKRTLPNVLQNFLKEFWVHVVASKIEASLPENLSSREAIVVSTYNEGLDKCCKNIVRVFCHRGESGFQLADQILDDLQTMSQNMLLPGSLAFSEQQTTSSAFFSLEAMWQEMSDCLLSLLQNNSDEILLEYENLQLPENLLQTFGDIEQFKNGSDQYQSLNITIGDWFDLQEDDALLPIKLIADFKQSQQLLFSNYLGMKTAQFGYHEFASRIAQGSLKLIPGVQAFSGVFDQSVKGLSKIAENQKQARLLAAEKAKAEAEKLLEDRRKAEEMSQLRAQEIAQRTQQMLAKRADKERLEKEAALIQLIRAFNLGAWISINHAGEPQRYKLVVKLAATGKYVFVDRLGIKKREFIEAELVKSLLNKEVEILSDGTEFEESLERVVSRIRMSK